MAILSTAMQFCTVLAENRPFLAGEQEKRFPIWCYADGEYTITHRWFTEGYRSECSARGIYQYGFSACLHLRGKRRKS